MQGRTRSCSAPCASTTATVRRSQASENAGSQKMGELGKRRRAGTPAKGIPWPARIPYVKGRSPYTESKGLARNSSAMHRQCLSWREVDLTAVKGGTETHP